MTRGSPWRALRLRGGLLVGGIALFSGCVPEGSGKETDGAVAAETGDSTVSDGEETGGDTGPCVTSAWFLDLDGDGHGDATAAIEACTAPDGYVAAGDDCAPRDPEAYPGAPERCNGLDDDCDAAGIPADELDADGDGLRLCDGDCDDSDGTVFPGAAEACNGRDDDCDGAPSVDELDADGDGLVACLGDCDDADPDVGPGDERCADGLDNDCDGVVDTDCLGDPDFDWSTCDAAVPGDHASIQDAIDAAASGDLICVAAGTWYENLDFGGKDVRVYGVDGASLTTIDGGGLGPVVQFVSGEGAGALLQGFTLTNGSASAGGGVSIDGASPTLVDLDITSNEATWAAGGGGVYVHSGAPTLTRVRVTTNQVSTWYCAAAYGLGGGLYLSDDDAVLEDVVVEGNSSGEQGGGLFLTGSRAALVNVAVRDNAAGRYGGAGLFAYQGSPSLTNVLVTGNTGGDYWAPAPGGGLRLYDSTAALTHVVVADNTSDGNGGGLCIEDGAPTFRNVVVSGNTAASGGGVYVDGGAPVFAYGDVYGNVPEDVIGMSDPTGTDGNVSVDPGFLAGTWTLDAASALIDAGDPALSDPDGTRADIGAFGGPGADGFDLDGDGYAAPWAPGGPVAGSAEDCDDADATVFPGAGC